MIAALKQNLLAGLRLAPAKDFVIGFDRAVVLLLVCFAVVVILSYPYGADRVLVDWYGVTSWAAVALLFGSAVLVIAKLHGQAAVGFATQLLSSTAWFLVPVLLVARYLPDETRAHTVLIYLGAIIAVVVTRRSFRATSAAAIVFLLATTAIVVSVNWYRFAAPALFYGFEEQASEPFATVDIEQLFHDQNELLDLKLDTLLPQRPDYADVYFVGFAGNGDEPVFKRDLSWVHRFFDDHFGTAGRSIALAATHETLATEALASRYNLRQVLARVGAMIDPNEDSVFLYLTSHGAQAGWLDVSLRPELSQQLTALELRQALDDAGIRWRIIVVSACYAGSFIEALVDEQTLVMTAASADRASFGCETESEMTWFADALFKQSLAEGMGLIDAFDNARLHIADRESAADFEHSDPQIFIGEAMRTRLAEIDMAVGLID